MAASDTAAGILGMAGTGASIGSLVPGVGTLAGAAAGAAIGLGAALFDYFTSQGDDPATAMAKAQQYDSTFRATPAQLASRNFDPTMDAALAQGATAFGQSQNVAAQQQALADALRARAEGRGGPSVAELQLRQGFDRNAALASGLVASQRGISPGLAARLGANAQGTANAQAAQQAAILRAQEQQAAQAALAQALAAQRSGDLNQQQLAAGMFGSAGSLAGQQRGQDLQNQMEAQRLNAQVAQGNQDAQLRAAGLISAENRADRDANRDMLAAGLSAAGQAGAMNAAQGGNRPVDVPLSANGEPIRAAHGAMVPGRARMHGDHPKNDTVPAMLSPGEVVLPRSIVTAPDAPDRAAAFVAALLASKNRKAA